MRELELYLHIPFCERKCLYCDFLSFPADDDVRERYVGALKNEILSHRGWAREYAVTSVFIGGGTPSVLSAGQMGGIMETLHKVFRVNADAEITAEANPGTVTQEKLTGWKDSGINRISFGLQSVRDKELKMLGRIHTFEEFTESYRAARAAGFSNINIDLISAIPGQTVQSWRETLKTAAELGAEHISAYSLILEEGTPFYERYGKEPGSGKNGGIQKGYPPLPDEESDRRMYEDTKSLLKSYGYHRYEISNYAKEGRECRHNLGYWERKEYLGLGLGASSLLEECRFHNTEDMSRYLNLFAQGREPGPADAREGIEKLTREDQMAEFMFLGLRKTEGIRADDFFRQFGRALRDKYGVQIEKLKNRGLLEEEEGRLRLTERGTDVSNYVFCEFL